jgi:hypothetical protein
MSRRPLNTGKTGQATKIDARVPDVMLGRLRDVARARGCSVGVVVREALDHHLPELEATGPPGKTTLHQDSESREKITTPARRA